MKRIRIHVLRTGEVRVSPYLPFGGDNCSLLKASGMTTPKSKWLWLPVFSYLVEHPKGLILFDTGWHREMSPAESTARVHCLACDPRHRCGATSD